MPKRVTGLTALQVKGLKTSGDYADGKLLTFQTHGMIQGSMV